MILWVGYIFIARERGEVKIKGLDGLGVKQ